MFTHNGVANKFRELRERRWNTYRDDFVASSFTLSTAAAAPYADMRTALLPSRMDEEQAGDAFQF